MKHILLFVLGLLLSVTISFSSAEAVPYVHEIFDYPGAIFTQATGINDSGKVVGHYWTTHPLAHGFVYDGLNFVSLDFPGAYRTWATGINNSGVIVGYYQPGKNYSNIYCFKYDGSFTGFSPPDTTNHAEAHGIDGAGNIVGLYNDTKGLHGFLFDGINYTPINYPISSGTGAMGINLSGQIVGYYSDGVSPHGFLYDGTNYVSINVPGANNCYALDINDDGVVVGLFHTSSHNLGFIFDGLNFQILNFSESSDTDVLGINNLGIIVGSVNRHGFIATPVPLPGTLSFFSIGLGGLSIYRRRRQGIKEL